MKRVVTGHDAQGRSVFLIEDQPQPIVLEKAGGLGLTELWATPVETRARRIEPRMLRDHERFRKIVNAAGLKAE